MPRTGLRFLSFWVLSTIVCVAFVDRPAATWSHAHLRGIRVFDWMTHMVDPLRAVSLAVLALSGLASLRPNWRPKGAWRIALAAALAVLLSVAFKEEIKFVFGRTWPETWTNGNPSWIQNGVFRFSLFHGGEGWASFPSGHMTQISALAATLWFYTRSGRWVGVLLAVLVAIGLYGSDYHFVGDMVAGSFLGTATAWLIRRFVLEPEAMTSSTPAGAQ